MVLKIGGREGKNRRVITCAASGSSRPGAREKWAAKWKLWKVLGRDSWRVRAARPHWAHGCDGHRMQALALALALPPTEEAAMGDPLKHLFPEIQLELGRRGAVVSSLESPSPACETGWIRFVVAGSGMCPQTQWPNARGRSKLGRAAACREVNWANWNITTVSLGAVGDRACHRWSLVAGLPQTAGVETARPRVAFGAQSTEDT